MKKRCPRCSKRKHLDQFNKGDVYCRLCRKEYNKTRLKSYFKERNARPEQRAYRKKYRETSESDKLKRIERTRQYWQMAVDLIDLEIQPPESCRKTVLRKAELEIRKRAIRLRSLVQRKKS